MAIELVKEKYSNPINTVEIGGGSAKAVRIGGGSDSSLVGSLDQPLVAVPVRIDIPVHLSGDPARACRLTHRRDLDRTIPIRGDVYGNQGPRGYSRG